MTKIEYNCIMFALDNVEEREKKAMWKILWAKPARQRKKRKEQRHLFIRHLCCPPRNKKDDKHKIKRRNEKMKKYKVREKSLAALFVNIWNSKKEIAEIMGFLFMLFAFSFGAYYLCALID